MIIKSKSYSTNKYQYLIEYIFHDKGRIDESRSFTLTHNLMSQGKEDIIAEFIQHDADYRKRRKNGRVLHHEIVSFHTLDKDHITLDILEDLSKKFIQLRGNKALVVAKPHIENRNIHVHFCFSGTEFQSSKALRLSKEEFKQIRIDLEEYQKEKYPQLEHSLVYLNAWQKERVVDLEKAKESEHEKQMKKRTGNPSHKDTISAIIQECFTQSESKEDFFKRVVDCGLSTYARKGKPTGVLYSNRKYRFKTLNITEKQLSLLSKNTKRINELKKILDEKQKDQSLSKGLER